MTDLVDLLTIDQIKEVLLPETKRLSYVEEIQKVSEDVEHLLQVKSVKLSGRLIRLIIFLAQTNLHVWHSKDCLEASPEKYYALLEFAQELNGLRNHIRNLLMEELDEAAHCHLRSTFLNYDSDTWYSAIIDDLKHTEKTS
ncbi:MAG: hypothetical protein AB7N91_13395 [Candidatus Tectimicrobiota bacterium]